MGRIYISQRDGASGYAGRVQEALTLRFGQDHVLTSAGPEAVRGCDAMAALIDRHWPGRPGQNAGGGIAQPEDPVRLEIATALQAGLPVVPVLLRGEQMPRPADLPADIAALAGLQPYKLEDVDWNDDIERLAEALAMAPSARPPICAMTAPGVGCLRTIGGEVADVPAVTFSEDGHVVSTGADGGIRVHRASDGKLLRHAPKAHRERVTAAAMARGRLATGSTDGTVRVWRLGDLQPEAAFRTASPAVFWLHRHFAGAVVDAVFATAVAPNGETVAFGVGGGGVHLGRIKDSRSQHLGAHSDRATALAFSPDGLFLASGGWDGTIRLWATQDGRAIATMTTPERAEYPSAIGYAAAWHLKAAWWVNGLSCSSNGRFLACAAGYGKLQLWRLIDRVQVGSWKAHEHDALSGRAAAKGIGMGRQTPLLGGVSCVAFGPRDETIASGGDDTRVRIWRASDGACLADLGGHAGGVTGVAFSPSGQLLASASWDGTIKIWACGGAS